jgi:hypothetical protein
MNSGKPSENRSAICSSLHSRASVRSTVTTI